MTDVSGREQARDARLERKRIAIERPALRALAALEQVGAGEDESGLIRSDVPAFRPLRSWNAADAEEERCDGDGLALAGGGLDRDRREAPARFVQLGHPRPQAKVDVRVVLHAVDEVRGHRLGEAVAAHHHAYTRAGGR